MFIGLNVFVYLKITITLQKVDEKFSIETEGISPQAMYIRTQTLQE